MPLPTAETSLKYGAERHACFRVNLLCIEWRECPPSSKCTLVMSRRKGLKVPQGPGPNALGKNT
jgi:hypothetical protein